MDSQPATIIEGEDCAGMDCPKVRKKAVDGTFPLLSILDWPSIASSSRLVPHTPALIIESEETSGRIRNKTPVDKPLPRENFHVTSGVQTSKFSLGHKWLSTAGDQQKSGH